MEEIKEMLASMQKQINDIQVSFEQKLEEGLQAAKEEIRNELKNIRLERKNIEICSN